MWAFHLTGTAFGHPLAVAGQEVFDGQGQTSGFVTEVWNGVHVDRLPFEGTYTVDATCRAKLSFRAEHPDLPDHHTADLYLSAGGDRASVILTSTDIEDVPADETLPSDTITLSGVAERLSKTAITCDNRTLRGVYGFHATGMTPAGPIRVAGHLDADGAGQVSVRFTLVGAGVVDPDAFYEGAYSIDGDCRGEMDFSGEHNGATDHHEVDFYPSAGGSRAFFVATKSVLDKVGDIDVNPLGLNDNLPGNASDLNVTISVVAERL